MLLGFLLLPLYSNYLTTEEYGIYSLAMATVNILGILSVNWVNVSTIRFYSEFEREEEVGKLMSLSLATLLGTTMICGLILGGIIYTRLLPFENFLVIFTMFFLMNLERLYMGYLQGARKVRVKAKLKILYTVVRFTVTFILLVVLGFNHLGIFYGNIGASLVTLALIVLAEPHALPKLGKKDLPRIKEYLSYGYPFIWILGVHWILTVSDRYMLEFIRGSGEVGIYALNYSLGEKTLLPMITIFMGTAAPIIFQQVERGDRKGAQDTLDQLFRFFLLLMLPAVIGLSVIRHDLAELVIRREFSEGVSILPVVALSYLFLGVRQYTNLTLEVEKKSREIGHITFIVGGVNLLLNLFFIRSMGYQGAAYATLLSYGLYYLLSQRKAGKLTDMRVRFRGIHGKILLAALLMGGGIALWDSLMPLTGVLMLLSKILLGILIYGGAVVILKVFTMREIKSFRGRRGKK